MVTIPRRQSTALLNSLGAGVVPRTGLEHIAVGRKREIEALVSDLSNVQEAGASFRLVTGRYGAGKSFLLQLLRNHALDRNFVVADADLSPERRLAGSTGQAVATYRELMRNLSTRTKPDGGALGALIDKWLGSLMSEVSKETKLQLGDAGFAAGVEERIHSVAEGLEGLVHGFDFAKVIGAYWRGYAEDGHEDEKQSALTWLRGEVTTKTDAMRTLGIRSIIDDSNWYDYLKVMAQFVTSAGYKGLVILIDEAVNLYKIVNTQSRTSNYEMLLAILNDTLQGKASHLAVVIGATPKMIEDERRGLFSYEALRSRLVRSRFQQEGLVDMDNPVIALDQLSHEELFHLLQRVLDVYRQHYEDAPDLSEDQLIGFMQAILSRVGASDLITPRELVRDFLAVLNLVRQNPSTSIETLVGSESFAVSRQTEDPEEAAGEYAEFTL